MKSSILSLFATAALVATAAGAGPEIQTRQEISLLYPYRTYRWWVWDGSVKEDPQDQLLVVKDTNPKNESTALVTFEIPAELEGNTCTLEFELWDRDVSTGTQLADVFSSVNPGNRGEHLGRIRVPRIGSAEWIESYGGYPVFDCPAGQLIGFEFVGAGDAVEIRWDIGVTGPKIRAA